MNLGLGLNIASKKFLGLFASGFEQSLSSTETPDPTAIYSLRLVNQDWFGRSVINVRRSGDNAEKEFSASDIETGIMGDWITSGGLVARSAFVVDWYDQSGNSNHASQGADASQPKIWDSITGLVTEGGRPALDFDGVDDNFATSDYIVQLSANDASVFAVVSTSDSRYTLTEGDAVIPFYSSNFILGDANGSSVLWVNATEFGSAISGHSLIGFIYDGINFQAYKNGATDGASGTATVNAEVLNQTVIGASADQTTDFYTGKIQELITYKSDQSANRTDIENNVNAYYAVYGVPYYRQRVADDSGTFAIVNRDQTVYNSVTIPEMPSLICSCDAYKATKLYNINPA